jgi:DHA1 family bicyclomycin/chloramphenicol resistance-like MFS transporter
VSPPRAVPLGLALLLASLSMVSPFAIDTFFPSMRAMQAEFGVGPIAIQQLLTAYLLPYAARCSRSARCRA